ncbi:sterol desaturase family protein [Aspergillus lucknowensis]|uniref:Fatty acid hydroxylase domain-containing protein n=1 Tax=Aspergillus lucknowensis TaxID=176173 RepID=A0ABR4M5V3_9EURO
MEFLTIPFLSVFVLPTLSSYSTRVNIIFFYMTWTTLVLAHTALRVELFGTLAARLVLYLLPSLLFFIFDIVAPCTAVVFKERGEAGLPTGSRTRKLTVREFRTVGICLFNFTLGIVAQVAVEMFLLKMPKVKPAVKVTMSVPMPWDITKHLLLGFFTREILLYTIHRYILHSKQPVFYPISQLHNAWFHSLRTPFPLTAHYDHPIPYLLSSFLPMYIPVWLFGFHMITFLVYTVITSIEDTFTFCGYSVMPSFLLKGVAGRIDRHLSHGGRAYFGRLGFVDMLMGTGGIVDDRLGQVDDSGSRGRRR